MLAAVSFPRFVEELVTGVFKAMVGSSVRQMEAFVDLLDSVAASTTGFADRTMVDDAARQWLVEQFPGAYEIGGDEEEAPTAGWADWGETERPELTVRQRARRYPPTPAVLRTASSAWAMTPTSRRAIRASPPALVRQAVAARRQNTLASLVMMGLSRIVVESGSIDASMRFHIDARSAAEDDRGSTADFRHTFVAAAGASVRPGGASAPR